MSKFPSAHPDDGALLGYLDGELSSREAREVERHIEACWQCRAELEKLQETVSECVRYRKDVLGACLPEPPNRWGDLYAEMERADRSMRPLFSRLLRAAPRGWGWVATAAAAALLAMALNQWRTAPSVKAATLLQRAVAAAEARSQGPRRIRVRTKTAQLIRTIGAREPVRMDAASTPMRTMLQSANYDWDDPLSARAFQRWRDSVAQKSDDVTAMPDHYRIRTTAFDGEVSTATLTLRTADLRPIEERLEFRNREWMEFTELTEPPAGSGETAAVLEAPVRPAEPSRPAAVAPDGSASISDELQVLAALHEIGADLGDPVDVRRSEGRVLVGGVGIPASRQKQIRSALEGLPKVSVEFTDPAPEAVAESQAPAAAETAAAPPGQVQLRIEQQLGGRAEFERFSSRMFDASEGAMARLYALRQLAQRFPAEEEAALRPKDRATLRDMARTHANALATQVTVLQHALGPVLANLGAAAPAGESTAATWQSAAEDLFRSGRRFEMLLSFTLGMTAAPAASSDPARDLAASLGSLAAAADRCRQLLAQQ